MHAKPDNLAKGLKHDKVRPLLQQGNRLDTLNDLYRERHHLYLAVADFIVDTGHQKKQIILNKIESLLTS